MKYTLSLTIDTDALSHFTDEYIAALWHAAQFNPAPIDDDQAGWMAEHIGREIIRRWLAATPPALWHHQGRHAPSEQLRALRQSVGAEALAGAERRA